MFIIPPPVLRRITVNKKEETRLSFKGPAGFRRGTRDDYQHAEDGCWPR
jgi:hypothetical protein